MLAFGTTLFILWSILWISENTLVNAIHLNVYHAKSVPILLMKKSKEIQYAINLGITFKYHINYDMARRVVVSDARAVICEARVEVSDAKAVICKARAEVSDARVVVCEARVEVCDAKVVVCEARVVVCEAMVEVCEARVVVCEARVVVC